MNNAVQHIFDSYPEHIRPVILQLRLLLLDVAESSQVIGPLEETLKWGQPSYLTSKSKSGTTVRIGWSSKSPEQCGLYVHCQTSLVEQYRNLFPELNFSGNRAILFDVTQPLPEKELRVCIEMAFTYHLNKN